MSRINLEDPILNSPVIRSKFKMGVTNLADANATIDDDMGPLIVLTGTANRTLTLPAIPADPNAYRGLAFCFASGAAFTLVIQNAVPVTIVTVPANGSMWVVCDGVKWYGG